MTIRSIGGLLLLLIVSAAEASVVFDVNFDTPLYSNGQSITGGPEPNEPTGANLATVSNSIMGFDSQAALFPSTAQMVFRPDSGPFDSGIHLITWDMGTPVDPSQGNVSFGSDTYGSLFSITFLDSNAQHPDDPVIEYGLGLNRPSIVNTTGTANAFQIIIDLDNDMLDFWINGNLLEDDFALTSGTDLDDVFFSQNSLPSYQFGMDNFRWEVVPEPSSVLLIVCGSCLLMTCRCRRRRA
jgi:hypothetical protein